MDEINILQQQFKDQKPKKGDKQYVKDVKPPVLKEIQMDPQKISSQKQLIISGIEVYFPFTPYPAQIKYMEQVIASLQENERNGLLQSPTGTGKTLCLLCATLGFLKHQRKIQIQNQEKEPIRIIYSSRTHSQLKQVAKELKRTAYLPQMTLLGSRDQYCIKREMLQHKGSILISQCMKAIKGNNEDGLSCQYFKGMHNDNSEGFENILFDIEDLKIMGRQKGFCPYFYTRRIKDCSDIILLPYNYLLELGSQSVFNIDMKNCIIIFDEAHNIQSVAEEGASYQLNLNHLTEVEKEIALLDEQINNDFRDPNRLKHNPKLKKNLSTLDEIDTQGLRSSPQDCRAIIQPMLAFKQYMINLRTTILNNNQLTQNRFNNNNNNNQHAQNSQQELGLLQAGKEIFQIFTQNTKALSSKPIQLQNQQCMDSYLLKKKAQSSTMDNVSTTTQFSEGLDITNISQYLHKIAMAIEDLSTTQNWGLDAWQAFLIGIDELLRQNLHFESTQKSQANLENSQNPIYHYKLYSKVDQIDPNQTTIFLWCLDPSISFHKLQQKGIRNILLTSGTLTPFASWRSELKIPFQIDLDNDHVIDVQQNLCAGILKQGPLKKQLNFSYDNRDNAEIFIDLGLAIINLCVHIPAGVLIIFSSYQLLEKTENIWRTNSMNIYQRLHKIKDIFKEPKDSSQIQDIMQSYYQKIKQNKKRRSGQEKNGAILMAVCRGKISEGIDFTDDLARAVFMVGVPYPPVGEKKVQVKKEYLDASSSNSFKLFRSNSCNSAVSTTTTTITTITTSASAPASNTTEQQYIKKLTGKDWYMQQAIRATNQAIGRVIRHKEDYGSIFFCDSRFDFDQLKNEISKWVKPVLKTYENFSMAVACNKQFFDAWNQREEDKFQQQNQTSCHINNDFNNDPGIINNMFDDELSRKTQDLEQNGFDYQENSNQAPSLKGFNFNNFQNNQQQINPKRKILGLKRNYEYKNQDYFNQFEEDNQNSNFNQQFDSNSNNYQDLIDQKQQQDNINNFQNAANNRNLKRVPQQCSMFDDLSCDKNTYSIQAHTKQFILSSLQNNNSKGKKEIIDNLSKSQEFSIQNLFNQSQEKENKQDDINGSGNKNKQLQQQQIVEVAPQQNQFKFKNEQIFTEIFKKRNIGVNLNSCGNNYSNKTRYISPPSSNQKILSEDQQEEEQEIDQNCGLCLRRAKNPQISINCNHVACEKCWDNWLNNQEQITCYKCKVRVNENNLQSL